MVEDDNIYDQETPREKSHDEDEEDEEFDSLEYDSGDLKIRLDLMEKRLLKMEEMMTSLVEQNQLPEDDEEFDEED